MANAYDVMRMAKMKGAEARAQEDYENFLDDLADYQNQSSWANMARDFASLSYEPKEKVSDGTGKKPNWFENLMGFTMPHMLISKGIGNMAHGLTMQGKKKPKFVSSDPTNPFSPKASSQFNIKSRMKENEISRAISEMDKESWLSSFLLNLPQKEGKSSNVQDKTGKSIIQWLVPRLFGGK